MNALEVSVLTKVYPSFKLDGVSFAVKEGRIAGLIGRNGAGKSTTIKAVLRLISATGEVKVFGKSMYESELEIKSMIGYVGGGFRNYPLKTVDTVGKVVSEFYPLFDRSKYNNYLAKFGIDEKKKVKELSEGMKVKFSLALAISHGARLLIMDEPTSGLDPLSREEFCDIILELVKNENVTVLFSTHITTDLKRIADDIIYISGGRVLESSPLHELLSRYSLARFTDESAARASGAIGVKSVKDGFEGLVMRGSEICGSVVDATLDDIMIHIETEIGGR